MEKEQAYSIVLPDSQANPNEKFFCKFEENKLLELIEKSGCQDLPVVIISIAGAFRKGKSFLLNFLIKYLKSKENAGLSWMEENNDLTGFDWRGGVDRTTVGILIWSEIFRISTPEDDIALILMDTQGTFDNKTTIRECSTIFALSSLMSSIQIYNLSGQIQENDLQHLQMFMEYGKLAMGTDCYVAPFQKLLFLIRDWSNPSDYPFGELGGNKYYSNYLKVTAEQPKELQDLRQHIKECFSDISCFLLPYPGTAVATKKSFLGNVADIAQDFKNNLNDFTRELLLPRNLLVKQICGNKIKLKQIPKYFKSYVEIFNSDEVPSPDTVFNATAKINNENAVTESSEFYVAQMQKVCNLKSILKMNDLIKFHEEYKEKAKIFFLSKKKFGGENFSSTYLQTLEKNLDKGFEAIKTINEQNIQKKYRDICSEAKKTYSSSMIELKDGCEKSYLPSPELLTHHESLCQNAFSILKSNMVDEDDNYLSAVSQLIKDIEAEFQIIESNNTEIGIQIDKLELLKAESAKKIEAANNAAAQERIEKEKAELDKKMLEELTATERKEAKAKLKKLKLTIEEERKVKNEQLKEMEINHGQKMKEIMEENKKELKEALEEQEKLNRKRMEEEKANSSSLLGHILDIAENFIPGVALFNAITKK